MFDAPNPQKWEYAFRNHMGPLDVFRIEHGGDPDALDVTYEQVEWLLQVVNARDRSRHQLAKYGGPHLRELSEGARNWLRVKKIHIHGEKIMLTDGFTDLILETMVELLDERGDVEGEEGVGVLDVLNRLAQDDDFYATSEAEKLMRRRFENMQRGEKRAEGIRRGKMIERVGYGLYRPTRIALQEGATQRQRTARLVEKTFIKAFQKPLISKRLYSDAGVNSRPQARACRRTRSDLKLVAKKMGFWPEHVELTEEEKLRPDGSPEPIEDLDLLVEMKRSRLEVEAIQKARRALDDEDTKVPTVAPDELKYQRWYDDMADKNLNEIEAEIEFDQKRRVFTRMVNQHIKASPKYRYARPSGALGTSYYAWPTHIMYDRPISVDSLRLRFPMEDALDDEKVFTRVGNGQSERNALTEEAVELSFIRVEKHCERLAKAAVKALGLSGVEADNPFDMAQAIIDEPFDKRLSMTLRQSARAALNTHCRLRDWTQDKSPGRQFTDRLYKLVKAMYDQPNEDLREMIAERHVNSYLPDPIIGEEIAKALAECEPDEDDHPYIDHDQMTRFEEVAFIEAILSGRYFAQAQATRPYDRIRMSGEDPDVELDVETYFLKDLARFCGVDPVKLTHGVAVPLDNPNGPDPEPE